MPLAEDFAQQEALADGEPLSLTPESGYGDCFDLFVYLVSVGSSVEHDTPSKSFGPDFVSKPDQMAGVGSVRVVAGLDLEAVELSAVLGDDVDLVFTVAGAKV